MKKTVLLSLAMFALVSLQSCVKENEYHSTQLYYPYAGRALVYADQPSDTIWFASTESWLLASDQTWCTIPTGRDHLENPYANTLVQSVVPIMFEPVVILETFFIVSVRSPFYNSFRTVEVQIQFQSGSSDTGSCPHDQWDRHGISSLQGLSPPRLPSYSDYNPWTEVPSKNGMPGQCRLRAPAYENHPDGQRAAGVVWSALTKHLPASCFWKSVRQQPDRLFP